MGSDGYDYDVAVVGGGIAGVYAAWRLAQDESQGSADKRILLVEEQKHLGGRIASETIPGIGIRAELGAMRYSEKQHQRLHRLIELLGLTKERKEFDLPMSYYLRGRIISTDSLKQGHCAHCLAAHPYRLRPDERKLEPGQLVMDAIERALKNFNFPPWQEPENEPPTGDECHTTGAREHHDGQADNGEELGADLEHRLYNGDWSNLPQLKPKDWEWIKKRALFQDIDLYDIGFWNLIQYHLSNEAVTFLQAGLGYASIVGNWNAAEAVAWYVADFDPDQQLYMLSCGFHHLIEEMIKQIKANDRVEIHQQWQLKTLTRQRNDGEIREAGAEKGGWELKFETRQGLLTRTARRVILALPRTPLEKIVVNDEDWNSNIKTPGLLATVRTHRLFKVFLVYDHAWWHDRRLPATKSGAHAESGRVNTDLPLRQVYYFGPRWIEQHTGKTRKDELKDELRATTSGSSEDRSGTEPSGAGGDFSPFAMIMASYSDSYHVGFWDPVAGEHHEGSDRPSDLYFHMPQRDSTRLTRESERALYKLVRRQGASRRLVNKVQHLLEELHGMKPGTAPPPIIGLYMNWERSPSGGGWHTWEPHVPVFDVAPKIRQPLGRSDNTLFICGEAYSREQGWIEGALTTTDDVLRTLGLRDIFALPLPNHAVPTGDAVARGRPCRIE